MRPRVLEVVVSGLSADVTAVRGLRTEIEWLSIREGARRNRPFDAADVAPIELVARFGGRGHVHRHDEISRGETGGWAADDIGRTALVVVALLPEDEQLDTRVGSGSALSEQPRAARIFGRLGEDATDARRVGRIRIRIPVGTE